MYLNVVNTEQEYRTMTVEEACWRKLHDYILTQMKENVSKSKYVDGKNDALLDLMNFCSERMKS